ncbi:hypothetical protein F5Y00DRAFT_274217 [Daldinia vernicosa]|uniref:uncharacterized protein n=1 Tax=Daldinia vernicosa TaxID=114800 RepID=UPI0020081A91|nr:uncharacterized protein F5Y00DRAFT_274217 [Daldinia vernicosa]KAI0851948.1 hypothetical protein F5Y00DRAFT_274217 [Daldinia vernicosa]
MAAPGNPTEEWYAADDETLNLIIQLQQEDLRELLAPANGEHTEGELIDAELAIRLYDIELNNAATIASDRQLVRQIREGNHVDNNIAHEPAPEEPTPEAPVPDEPELGEPAPDESTPDEPTPDEPIPDEPTPEERIDQDDHVVATLSLQEPPVVSDSASNSGSPEGATPQDTTAEIVEMRACLACQEMTEVTRLTEVPCSHEYCPNCLATLFRNAMTDESLFPPRCCRRTVPLDPNEHVLGEDLVRDFQDKVVEYSTPDRLYCHQTTCSAFIRPDMYVENIATCDKCQSITCVTCKGPSHDGDCPHDEELRGLMQLAQEEGWQQCYNCKSMVELNIGCHHITCRCGAQFCYVCGLRWKTCACAQWDENRLFDRAEAIYNRGRNARQGPNAQRRVAIRNIAEGLRVNHGCDLHVWTRRLGPYVCDLCNIRLSEFIFECDTCHMMVCRRCRDNRP